MRKSGLRLWGCTIGVRPFQHTFPAATLGQHFTRFRSPPQPELIGLWLKLDHVERPRSRDQPTTTDLIAALKDIILQQGHTIEKIQTDLAEVKNQNGELREELKSVQTKLDAHSVSPPTTRSWASVAAGSTSLLVLREN